MSVFGFIRIHEDKLTVMNKNENNQKLFILYLCTKHSDLISRGSSSRF